jgi:hypothetical protein
MVGPSVGSAAGASASVPFDPFPLVSVRERTVPPVSVDASSASNPVDLELLIRRIIREESGLTPVTPAPIETFFHKIVMLRNRLRTLEQQVNSTDLPEDAKVKLQSYITGCYGSLTSFNILFADEDDQFKGSSNE